jgi:hypothetical protein
MLRKNSTAHRQARIGRTLQEISSVYREDAEILANLLYDKGVGTDEIAKRLGVSKAAVSQKYPRTPKHSQVLRRNEVKKQELWQRTHPKLADIFHRWWTFPHLTFDQLVEHEREKSHDPDFSEPEYE